MPSRKDRGNAQIFEHRNVAMASLSRFLLRREGRSRRNFIAQCAESGWRSIARLGRTTLMTLGQGRASSMVFLRMLHGRCAGLHFAMRFARRRERGENGQLLQFASA
jgi:hypothetical protein